MPEILIYESCCTLQDKNKKVKINKLSGHTEMISLGDFPYLIGGSEDREGVIL